MYQYKFQEKERIDFIDQNDNNALTGQVDIALDEMVRCVSDTLSVQNNQPICYWIETESDKLAPPNTITNSEKRKFYQYYMQLFKNIQNRYTPFY